MAKCGHVGCEKELGAKHHGHLCTVFYRSGLSCEELDALWIEWAMTHQKEALDLLADFGALWASDLRNERRETDMKVGSL